MPVTDIDEVENAGFVNPLIAGWEGRLTILEDINAMFFKEAMIEQDPTTLRRDMKLRGGIIPEPRTPAGGALDVSLAGINILVFTSTTFITRLLFSSDAAPTDATLGDSAYVRALGSSGSKRTATAAPRSTRPRRRPRKLKPPSAVTGSSSTSRPMGRACGSVTPAT